MNTLQIPEDIKAFIVSVIREELYKQSVFSGLDKELLERMVRVEEELKPELCNRNRDEGIKRKERGTYVDEAQHRYGDSTS